MLYVQGLYNKNGTNVQPLVWGFRKYRCTHVSNSAFVLGHIAATHTRWLVNRYLLQCKWTKEQSCNTFPYILTSKLSVLCVYCWTRGLRTSLYYQHFELINTCWGCIFVLWPCLKETRLTWRIVYPILSFQTWFRQIEFS